MANSYDAVVVGAGPNGLAAAIELARAGKSVLVLEAASTIGGGARTEELTLPGFRHDVCSAIHPLGSLSPFLRGAELEKHGVTWIDPPVALAHPLDDGTAATIVRDLGETARSLGIDEAAWRDLYQPFADDVPALFSELLQPIRVPKHPLRMARFGLTALRSAVGAASDLFRGDRARALFGGCSAHAIMPLEAPGTAAFGLVLAIAGHAVGWPFPRGGSDAITKALTSILTDLGGEVRTGHHVRKLEELPPARAILFDVMPRHLADIAGDALPSSYRAQLRRYRHGPGTFKIDWALRGPIPWRAEACRRAGTVHVGGTLGELAASERGPFEAFHSDKPFVLVAQQSLFDDTRAPAGQHTGWAYCHVPNGSTVDRTEAIESQIERFAPGFRDLILARQVANTSDIEAKNAGFIGGDIGGGLNDLAQTLARPLPRWDPYSTPNRRLYLCSSATPPGGGVHGMCGYGAARAALKRAFA